jgi:predicted  nucleic acid-binding Zn-ribbon protein
MKGGVRLGAQRRLIIDLQKNDTEIIRINNRKKLLPRELAKLDGAFHAFCADFEKDQETLEDLNKTHKEREEKLKRGFESLKKARDRLSEVKTNKEYQAMLKEIEITELKNSVLEDEILIVMDRLDQVRKVVRVREKELDENRRDHESQKQQIEQELTALNAEISIYLERDLLLKEQITPDLLKKYETIKHRSHGLAVVAVWKEICRGCHMNIPPQLYIELQKDNDIKYCPHCNRIIYWEDQNRKGE